MGKLSDRNKSLSFIPQVQAVDKAGFMMEYANDSDIPTGWLPCNGQEVSETLYPELFAAIGTSYNDGTETAGFFRVPKKNASIITEDWVSYTLVNLSGTGTYTGTGNYRRVGDIMEVYGSFNFSAAPTGRIDMSLPSGFTYTHLSNAGGYWHDAQGAENATYDYFQPAFAGGNYMRFKKLGVTNDDLRGDNIALNRNHFFNYRVRVNEWSGANNPSILIKTVSDSAGSTPIGVEDLQVESMKINSIVDKAGTGAPNFANGLTSDNNITATSGQLRADNITNAAGTGAPNFDNGLTSDSTTGITIGPSTAGKMSANRATVANGAFIDVTLGGAGPNHSGILTIAAALSSNAANRRAATYAIHNRSGTGVATQLSNNNVGSPPDFTISFPDGATCRVTNTTGADVVFGVGYFGSTGG